MNLKKFSWQDITLSVFLFVSLGFFLVSGANTGNTTLIGVTLVFLILAIAGFLGGIYQDTKRYWPSKWNFFSYEGNNFANSLGFIAGFIIGYLITFNGSFSVIGAYSSVQQSLASDPFFQNYVVTVAAPVAEEYFFLVGAMLVMAAIFNAIGNSIKSLGFFKNVWFQTATIPVLNAIAFAAYHTNQPSLSAFFWSAMLFRVAINVVAALDMGKNIIPYISASFLFAVGFHMANNINATLGLTQWIALMFTNPMGWIVLFFIGLNVYGVVEPFLFGRKVRLPQ